MYVVIVGGGRIGFHLAQALLNAKHEVAVIEKHPAKVQALRQALGNIAILGDGSDTGVLHEAGAERADLVIATTGDDEVNLAVCQMAKHLWHTKRTLAVVHNPENEELFHILGVDDTVSATRLLMAEIEKEVPAHLTIQVMPVSGGLEVISVEVPAEAGSAGRPLGAVHLPPGTVVAAIVNREGHPKPVTPHTVVEAYDHIIAVVHQDKAEAFLEALAGEG
ncbi:MAG: TrkA family potassium uptake protein [Dehalococcoidia bacterium]|nr:TrkA family potassium uptake protein [Dehalococcoidia bacterium]MDW8120501.1 TrkA family potassium uptake protein [Chloroflexota bacterium]